MPHAGCEVRDYKSVCPMKTRLSALYSGQITQNKLVASIELREELAVVSVQLLNQVWIIEVFGVSIQEAALDGPMLLEMSQDSSVDQSILGR